METLLYLVNVAGNGLLARELWYKRVYRTHPAFTAFIFASALRTLGIAALRISGRTRAYDLAWWLSAPLIVGLLFWTVGELWRKREWGMTAGLTFVLCYLALQRYSFMHPWSFSSLLCAFVERDMIRWLGFGLCGVLSAVYAEKRKSNRAGGLFLVCWANAVFLGTDYGWPVIASWSAALLLWLKWSRTYRAIRLEFSKNRVRSAWTTLLRMGTEIKSRFTPA